MPAMIRVPRRAGTLVGLFLLGLAPALTARAQSPQAAVLYNSAVKSFNGGKYDLAVPEYESLLAKYPNDKLAPDAQHYLGVSLLQLEQHDKAIAAFAAVIKKWPDYPRLDGSYYNLGKAQLKKGRFDAAAASFDTVVRKFPRSKLLEPALYDRGEAHYNGGNKAEALKSYADFVAKFPKHTLYPDALYALGVTQQELGQNAAAAKTFGSFLQALPKHKLATEVSMWKGETAYALGDFAEAEQRFAAAAGEQGFRHADYSMVRQGEAMYAQQKYEQAVPVFLALPAKFPQSQYVSAANLSAGKCLFVTKKWDQARAALAKVIPARGEPANEAAHLIARAYLNEGSADAALKTVEPVLKGAAKSPFLVDLLMDQADAVYETDGRQKESIALYEAVHRADPKHRLAPQALYNAAFAAQVVEDYARALDLAGKFVAQYPNYSDKKIAAAAMNVLAESYLLSGQHAEAEKTFTELLQKYSGDAKAESWQIRLAVAMHQQEKHAETIDYIEPLLAKLKDADAVAEAQFLIGFSQFAQKQYAPAAKALAASLAAQPKWRDADKTLLLLAQVQRLNNELKPAIATVKKLIAEFPRSDVLERAHFRLAEYCYAADDFATSAKEYQTVIQSWPKSDLVPYAVRGLGLAHHASGEYAQAEKSFSELLEKFPRHEITPRALLLRAKVRERFAQQQAAADDAGQKRRRAAYQGAVDDAGKFLQTDATLEDKSAARHVLAVAQDQLKMHDAAAKTFQALLDEDPKYADAASVLYDWAWALKAVGKEQQAAGLFARLAKEHPGSDLADNGHFRVGEFLYNQALAQKRDARDGWQQTFAKAAAEYELALAKVGSDSIAENVYHMLGRSYFQGGNYDRAGQVFARQVAKFSGGGLAADGQFMVAECLFRQEQYKEAFAAFTKSLAKPSTNATIRQVALLHAGQAANNKLVANHAEAAKLLEKLLADFPQTAYKNAANYELGWARYMLAQANPNNLDRDLLKQATDLFQGVIDSDTGELGARAQFSLAEIQFLNKNFQQAVLGYNRVASAYGKNKMQPDALFQLARCFDLLKKPKYAIESYQTLIKDYPGSDKVAAAKAALKQLGAAPLPEGKSN